MFSLFSLCLILGGFWVFRIYSRRLLFDFKGIRDSFQEFKETEEAKGG